MPEDPLTLKSVIVRAPGLLANELAGDTVLLNAQTYMFYGLNQVGSRIWELLAQPVSVEELCDALVAQFDVDVDTCRTDTLALLRELYAEKMISVATGSP